MKKNIIIIVAVLTGLVLTGCNNFLDELPDRRAELDTPDKLAQMLLSAYPTELPTRMFEIMSDNRTDNGPSYRFFSATDEQAYKFEDITDVDWDVPTRVWQRCYISISSANQVLDAIEEYGFDEKEIAPIRAEALLCRAFGHFMLANTFCIAYNPESSATDLGIPYVEKPETTINPTYERGTVEHVYEKINADIEAALPHLSDAHYSVAKYHFNTQAAYAFATRFNLFYGKWDKVIEYATQALGSDPYRYLRDGGYYAQFINVMDKYYPYISVDESANYLLIAQRSMWGRIYRSTTYSRFGMPRAKANHTFWQWFPWGSVANGYGTIYGNEQNLGFAKMEEIFEIINPIGPTGQPHTVLCMFTGDETLLARAEAYVMKGDLESAKDDLNIWYRRNNPAGTTYSVADIVDYYKNGDPARVSIADVNSRFEISNDESDKSYMFHAIMCARRLETCTTGWRWCDLKRHGIRFTHPVMRSATELDYEITIEPYEARTAIQLPADVIIAGLPANPR